MDAVRWISLVAVTLLLAEGFALSLFPQQIRQLLIDSDSRSLQIAGLFEATVGAVLFAALMLG